MIPTFDVRTLTAKQVVAARAAFEELRERRFLPFDQIDEDPARAELDRRLLVDVLGLPESLVASDGPLDLLRRKLAGEPQIHGGKKTRVVFYDVGEGGRRGGKRTPGGPLGVAMSSGGRRFRNVRAQAAIRAFQRLG